MNISTNSYGYCPVCGARGILRERRPNGDDTCDNGHTYPSKDALTADMVLNKDFSIVSKCGINALPVARKTYYVAYAYLSPGTFSSCGWAYGDAEKYECEGLFDPFNFKKHWRKITFRDDTTKVVILNVMDVTDQWK
jgi:hypothetical protein